MAIFSPTTKGILWLIAGFTIHLFLGCLYLFGNIQVYLTSYLHKYDESVTLNSTLMIGPILGVTQGTVIFVGPYLLKELDPRLVIIFGSLLAFIGLISSSFVTNLYAFSFLFGAFYGWGLGVWYLVPL